jgi:stage V sporulation protein G
MAETTPVTITILNIERVAKGDVVALAIVELEVAGVVIVLQGVAVTKLGRCRAPLFRHPRTGQWLPAVRLPASLSAAVATEVLVAVSAGGVST